MIWQDVLINRSLTEQELASGLATIFAVDPASISVVDEIVALTDDDLAPIQILGERSPMAGEFSLLLTVILRTPSLQVFAEERGDLPLLQSLCDVWNVDALVDDGTVNPYRWLLLRPRQEPQVVKIDADQLAEHDAYVLVRQPVASAG